MTERLYGPPLSSTADARFTARVVRAEPRGERVAVVLDRTQFYPTGGGQPCDLGTLAAEPVLEVVEEGDDVLHLVAGSPGEWSAGREVTGRVDLARRRDHMEQHTGQHLLSAILLARFGLETRAFHLGSELVSIDLAGQRKIDAELLAEAEREANAAIRADHPVTVSVHRGEAAREAARGLRKPPEAEALASPRGLRIVEIGPSSSPVDRDPCGGTHVGRTGELGTLVVLGAEAGRKGETRVLFAVGGRATAAIRERLESLAAAGRTLSTGHVELPARAEKLLREVKELSRARIAAEERALAFEAEAAARAAPAGERVLARRIEGPAPELARAWATALVRARPDAFAAVVHAGERATIVLAAGESAPARDLGKTIKDVLAPFGGKGGGAGKCVQGAAPDAARADELLAAAVAALA